MNHLDLFSGIGGFSLAASWVWGAAHNIISFIEIDKFCQKVLAKHWPDVPIHDDIRTYKHDRTNVDLVTGGFPCQPFSVAGKQAGAKDDRFLWPQMLRVIREIRPTWVIGENVAGIKSIFEYEVFSDMEDKSYTTKEEAKANFKGISEREGRNSLWVVLDDLKKLGYDVQPFLIPACGVDAPHRRDRVWIVAHSNGKGLSQRGMQPGFRGKAVESFPRENISGNGQDVADTEERTVRAGLCETEPGEIGRRRSCNGSRWKPEPNVGRVANGVSGRVDRLKSLGNSIIPQCVYPIMQAIKAIDESRQP